MKLVKSIVPSGGAVVMSRHWPTTVCMIVCWKQGGGGGGVNNHNGCNTLVLTLVKVNRLIFFVPEHNIILSSVGSSEDTMYAKENSYTIFHENLPSDFQHDNLKHPERTNLMKFDDGSACMYVSVCVCVCVCSCVHMCVHVCVHVRLQE